MGKGNGIRVKKGMQLMTSSRHVYLPDSLLPASDANAGNTPCLKTGFVVVYL